MFKTFLPSSACSAMAACLLALGMPVCAAEQTENGKVLNLGMAYVPPAYQAGAKFRTPEAIDMALAENMAKETRAQLKTVPADRAKGSRLLASGKLDALIVSAPAPDKIADRSAVAIPTGYSARPMAIMRTDTTIKTPAQLRGRKVCVAQGSPYVGMLASRYGAVETVARAPADSLLAVRTGACDAAVHDSTLLEELIKLPEWKKFSAAVYLGPVSEQAIVVRRDDAGTADAAKKVVTAWQHTGFIRQEIKRMARHIAFEVYLDQDVPDCH